ncbi:hypothetical protein [Streptomyces sp. NBC_00078]|uniref:hypothetical protein n=1 Tax=unclassified Streptomyces TaxID=2593676 RepID=UPI00225B103E|nr:hypothetical protein [Streptomyces sp. NBC_00078]MCX5418779.1 hypothetical protein [Streptomyces sp. NBC_00078]
MFDLRTEAEMRLHSERTARELALKKEGEVAPASREADRESASDETQSPPT